MNAENILDRAKLRKLLPGFWIQRDRDEQLTLLAQRRLDNAFSETLFPSPRPAKDCIAFDFVVSASHESSKGPLQFQHRLYNTKTKIQVRSS